MLLRPRTRHKRFTYTPRFYDPTKEENIKRRMRIKSRSRRKEPTGFIWIAVLLIMALYIYTKL